MRRRLQNLKLIFNKFPIRCSQIINPIEFYGTFHLRQPMLGKIDFGLATLAKEATCLISLSQVIDPFESFEIFEAHDFVVARLGGEDLCS